MKNNKVILLITFFLILIMIALVLFTRQLSTSEQQRFMFQSYHMGTQITIILYAENETIADLASDAAFDQIEKLNTIMSDYLKDSEVNRLSETSGTGQSVEVSDPLFDILKKSKRISKILSYSESKNRNRCHSTNSGHRHYQRRVPMLWHQC